MRDKFNVIFGGQRVEQRLTNFAPGSHPTSERIFVGEPYGQKIRQVCASCNNGWLNELENQVEENLVGLMRADSVPLPLSSRERLARWAAKTALVRQLLSDPSVVFRDSRLFSEVANGSVPAWSWLFAARIEKAQGAPRTRSTLLTFVTDDHEGCILLTTLHLEELLLVSVMPLDDVTGGVLNRLLAAREIKGMTTLYPRRRLINWDEQVKLPRDFFDVAAGLYAAILQLDDPGTVPAEPPEELLQRE